MADALQLIRENQEKYARGEDAKRLSIKNCKLIELPDELFECVWLDWLDISSNQIADYSFLEKLTQLRSLNLRSNQIADYSFLEKLTQLRSLNLRSNQIADYGFLEKLTQLQSLDLSFNQIVDYSFLEKITQLRSLNLNSNRIIDYDSLEKLTQLRSLDLSSGQIADYSFLEKLIQLQSLNLSSSRIVDYSFLGKITQLQSLDLSFNQITDYNFLEKLTQLKSLNLRDNQIFYIDFLEKLTQLQSLNLTNNQITDISPLKELTQLKSLYIGNNKITNLRPIISQINKGLAYDFSRNPWQQPPIEIIKKNRATILNYFVELEKGGETKGLEAKVIFIGEGLSGKTSLRTRLLQGEKAPLPEPDKRTRGLEIQIEPLTVDLLNGEQMRLNIFDFGGQTHYKPLHQFFYSHRSLYVLVTRNGDDSNEFDFWFDTAQLFGGGSPVLVVNNLFGDVQSGFNRSKFSRFDGIIKDSLNANLLTSDGFPAVQKRIKQLAETLPHIHQTIPKTWANVRGEIEKLRNRNIIHLDEYFSICAKSENGEMDRERALHCSAYLHDIGVCLHYQHFPSLRRYLIVKNEWATEAVYRVMDDPAVNKAHGHFSMDDLTRIWKPTKEDLERDEDFHYEDYVSELLELMREFKLCYPLRLQTKEFVAPHLLPTKQEKDQKWLPDSDLQFEMEYDFMPPGLFSRFVVSRYEDIAGENRDLVWRDEVFFQWDKAMANVNLPSRAGKKAIVFKVQGADPEERKLLLTSLLRDLKKLHAETPGILAEEKIPCICDACKSLATPHFYPYSHLKSRKENNKKTIECIHPPFAEIEVNMLLGNIFPKEKSADSSRTLDKLLIRNLLKADELEKVLDELDEHAPDDCVLLQAEISRIKQSSGLGLASQEDASKIRQKTIKLVLDWLKEQP